MPPKATVKGADKTSKTRDASKSPKPTKKEESKATPLKKKEVNGDKKPKKVAADSLATKKPKKTAAASPDEKKKNPKADSQKKKSKPKSSQSKSRRGNTSERSDSPDIEIMTINSKSDRANYKKAGEVMLEKEKIIDHVYEKLNKFNDQESINLNKVNVQRSEMSQTPPINTTGRSHGHTRQPESNGRAGSFLQPSVKSDQKQYNGDPSLQVPASNGYMQPSNNHYRSPSQNLIPEQDMEETYSMGGGAGDLIEPIVHNDSNQNHGGMEENEVTKLFDQIQELQNKNIDLKKKCHKYKKQVSLIPELREELASLRENLNSVEQGYTASKRPFNQSDRQFKDTEDVSFGKTPQNPTEQGLGMQGPVSRSTLSIEQLRKILDRMEEKNYSVVKENIDLKGQITELKEQVIKRNNFIEGLRSDCKIAIMDLKYFHQKLNHGQEITNLSEPELTNKYLVSQIDHLIDEKLATIRDAFDRQMLQEQRINALKDQILNLQSMVDRNQDVVVHQSARLQTLEDVNKGLKHDVIVKSEIERQLDGFKLTVKAKLIKIKGQIEGEERGIHQDVSVDSLLDWISDRTYQIMSNERTLRAHIEQLTGDLHKRNSELDVIRSGKLIPRSMPSEERARLQEHIAKLEEMLDNRNRLAATTGSFGGSIENARVRNDPAEGDIIEAFLYQMLHKVKNLTFQKCYLKLQNLSLQEKLQKLEFELHAIAPSRSFNRSRAIKKLRKCVQTAIFLQRLKRANILQFGEVLTRKKAADRLCENWSTFKAIWEPEIRQNVRLHSTAERLLKKFTPYPLILKEIPRRFYNNDPLEVIDTLKVKFGELTHRANESKYQVDQQALRMRNMEQDRYFQMQPRADQVQEDIITRQRVSITDLEAKIEEMRMMYEQKIRYLKQDLDMKKHQIDNMRSLIQVPEQNSIEQEPAETGMKFKPIRIGGGFLLPSQHPELYAEHFNQQQQLEIQENKH